MTVWHSGPTTVMREWRSIGYLSEVVFSTAREPENRQSASKVSNYPNPYAPSHVGSANITYQIDSPGLVTLAIFNSLGHPVRVLVNEFQEVGVWTAAWDGHDQAGLPVSSGVYLYELIEGGRRYQSAITVVR